MRRDDLHAATLTELAAARRPLRRGLDDTDQLTVGVAGGAGAPAARRQPAYRPGLPTPEKRR